MLDDSRGGVQLSRSPGPASGWSLIELLIAMTILAISLALGLPALSDVIDQSRLRAASADLEHAARVARSEALRRNTTVTLSVSGPQWQVRAGNAPNEVILHQGTLGSRVLATSAAIRFSGSGFASGAPTPSSGRLDLDLALAADPLNCSQAGPCRRLQVDVGGAVRVCDPRKAPPQTGACS